MTHAEMERQIASRTGEEMETIASRGFSLLKPMESERDREPLVVNWDELDQHRIVA